MDYIELKCDIPENTDIAREVLTAELGELGYESFQDHENGLLAYIPENNFNIEKLDDIYCVREKIFGKIVFSHQLFKDKNWNEFWEKNFQPVVVAEKLLIRAPFHNLMEKYEHEIILEPKMSFGTGHHATTYLMLEAMLNIDFLEKEVLDIGCGTGILSIFASIKGAKSIIGFDNNDWAFTNALENIDLNNAKNVEILQGEIRTVDLKKKFDIVVANINRNVILDEMEHYILYLKPNGFILFSGILKENYPEINKIALQHGLTMIEKAERNNWLMLKYQI